MRSTCGYAADPALSKSKFSSSTSIVWPASGKLRVIYGYALIQYHQKVSFYNRLVYSSKFRPLT
jgi:hypothetical protein